MSGFVRKKGFFRDAVTMCRFETENDAEPGAVSASQWIEMGDKFYGINVWSADPGKLPLLQAISDLIVASAGSSPTPAKESVKAEPRPLYRANLRPGLQRLRGDSGEPNFVPFDISDVYSDSISTVRIMRTAAVAPSQMTRSFQNWASLVGKSTGTEYRDVASIEVAKNPGRIGSWVIKDPRDRSRQALFMMTASFGPDETWIIYELQPLARARGINRIPSTSLVSDMDRFREWTVRFEKLAP